MATEAHTTQRHALSSMRAAIPQITDHNDLFNLFDALMTVANVTNAMGQRPHFWLDRSMELTPGGKVVETLTEAIDFLLTDTMEAAKALPAPTGDDRHMKALTLAAWEVFNRSSPIDIIAVTAPLATETH